MYRSKIRKSSNRDCILECIFRNPKISRKEISDITGITPATVTTTVAGLIREDVVLELGEMEEDQGSIGRKRIALDINPQYACAIGVEFNMTAFTVCATNLHGEILYEQCLPYTEQSNSTITEMMIEKIWECMDMPPVVGNRLVGIGIAIPGHLDPAGQKLVSTREVWSEFDASVIKAEFDCPVVFENNVRCMAVHHYLHHPGEAPASFAFFHVGLGMFCANIVDEELFIGTTYWSGEIGHTVFDPDGRRCSCGKRGCLQTIATEQSLLEQAASIYRVNESTLLHSYAKVEDELTIDHIATAYTLGDPSVRRFVAQTLKYLSVSILNIAILMNPEKLFLHGKLFNYDSIRRDLTEQVQLQLGFTKSSYQLGTVEILPCVQTDGAAGGAALAILKCMLHS